MTIDFIETLIRFCVNLSQSLLVFAEMVLDAFDMRLDELPWGMLPAGIGNAIDFFLENSPIGDISLFPLIFGGGILVYFIYQFAIWALNLVT